MTQFQPVLLKANGETVQVSPQSSSGKWTLDELRSLLGGGFIEIVRLRHSYGRPRVLVVDDEGWMKADPILNIAASQLYGGPIAGDALFCEAHTID